MAGLLHEFAKLPNPDAFQQHVFDRLLFFIRFDLLMHAVLKLLGAVLAGTDAMLAALGEIPDSVKVLGRGGHAMRRGLWGRGS